MNKLDLALNNQQWLICHKTKPNKAKMLTTRRLRQKVNF